jgi:O-antigen ligase
MPRPLPGLVGRWAEDWPFALFLLTVVVSLFRARDLPEVELGIGGTGVGLGPADVLLLATALLALRSLHRQGRLRPPASVVAALAFAALLFASALPNGPDAIVTAGKLAEFAALTLGALAFLDSSGRLQAFLVVLVCFAAAAVGWGIVGFIGSDPGRQGSFMGEHDMAALGTLVAAVGLARVHARDGYPGLLGAAGLVVGVIAAILGASLASVIGIYLVSAAVLVTALRRGELRRLGLVVTLAAALVATAGTLAMRHGELGFLQSWFGSPAERPGEYAASWSQRLIYTYIGGRIFLDQPWLGTGWHGLLPPEEFAEYLPDARDRFPDQPPRYFPPADRDFIPQQTYDQVLFELGLVGGAFFLVLLALAAWRAAVTTRRRGTDAAYVPPTWLAGMAGALAGAALFGGAPLTALFWLTLGVVAADPERT